MRVLHVHCGMCGGGIETFISTMAVEMQDTCESCLFSLAPSCVYEGPSLPTYDHEYSHVGKSTRLIHLMKHARAWRPDIIHTHSENAAAHAVLIRHLIRHPAKLIMHWHSTRRMPIRAPLGGMLGRHAVGQADRLIACSDAAARYHGEAHGVRVGDVCVLYNPVDTSAYRTPPDHTFIAERIGVEDGELRGVFLGRLKTDIKGLDVLCEAMRLLPDLPLRVGLIGPGDVEALRERLKPPPSVTISGAVGRKSVPGLLRACDICLQPSRSEGFPVTVIEAMAAGLPVIASRVGGVPEAVEDGVTGTLVPPDDPEALARAIRWMIEHSDERRVMGDNGRMRARRFDVKVIGAQLRTIYSEVLNGSGH